MKAAGSQITNTLNKNPESVIISIKEDSELEKKPKETEKPKKNKKKGPFLPFLLGCSVTAIVAYVFLYQQIWKSAHQMEEYLADVTVNNSEQIDILNQEIARISSQLKELKDMYPVCLTKQATSRT